MKIPTELWNGRRMEITVQENDKVEFIFSQIQGLLTEEERENCGPYPSNVRLVAFGRVLLEGTTLKDYNLKTVPLLMVVLVHE
jgi:hypothetical protein